jgi:photosystem II stability/assembly factor-like uncharacterized protein
MLLLALGLAGCDGGDDDDSDASSPTPSPTATAQPITTDVPSPTTTSTPNVAFDEVVLGVASKYGAQGSTGGGVVQQVVLRNDGEEWESIELTGLPVQTGVNGVTFATASVAWLFGGQADADGLLRRSDDAGRTWRDVSSALPAHFPQIFAAAFVDQDAGYILGRGSFAPPVVLVTHDGGATWRDVALPPSGGFPLVGSCAFGLRLGAAELARYDGGGLGVIRLDDTSAPIVIEPPGGASLGGMNAFATAGAAGWIVEAYVASILRSESPGAPWVRQPVVVEGPSELRAIDMRDPEHGLAGGFTSKTLETRAPLLLVTDDGTAWEPARVAGPFDGWSVYDVLRLRGDGAVATATDITSGETATVLFHSDDGGRSWRRDPTPFEHGWRIHDLARNTERR